MPKSKGLPTNDARRPLSPTDAVVIANISRLYRQHGTIAGNQSQLARDAEIDQTFISKLLKGKTSVSVSYAHLIAKALGVEAWHLLVPGDWPLANPPVLQPLTETEKQLYLKMQEATAIAVQIAMTTRPTIEHERDSKERPAANDPKARGPRMLGNVDERNKPR